MVRALAGVTVALWLSTTAFGQSPDKPAFESADVHTISVGRFGTNMSGGVLRGTRYDVRSATLVELIRLAYGIDDERILGGPSWLENEHYDVLARTPAGTSADAAKQMLQALLADRFGLVVRHDNKPVDTFVLTKGKGAHKMKPAAGGSATGCQGQGGPPPSPDAIPNIVVTCKSMTMKLFADELRQMAGGYFNHEVIDETGIDGTFDFDLSWTPRGALARAGADGVSAFDAVDKQLGLKVEPQKRPMAVIVIEKANQKPTANAPGVGEVEGPVEFEVAELKPSPPDSQGLRFLWQPGGRVNGEGPLSDLIAIALAIPPNLRSDLLVGMPKAAGDVRYSIVAKTPTTGAGAGTRDGGREQPPPLNVALVMLQNLFKERFNLKWHTEDQNANVYAIVVDKGGPKMKKSDGTDRANCKPDPNAAPPNPKGTPQITWKCVNTTMKDLADNVTNWAGGYFDHPAFDATGLTGGYDFVLSWTPKQALHPASTTGDAGVATDPGGLSVFEAFEKQLGLKLDQQKRMIPVTVIDHVEEKPTGM